MRLTCTIHITHAGTGVCSVTPGGSVTTDVGSVTTDERISTDEGSVTTDDVAEYWRNTAPQSVPAPPAERCAKGQ